MASNSITLLLLMILFAQLSEILFSSYGIIFGQWYRVAILLQVVHEVICGNCTQIVLGHLECAHGHKCSHCDHHDFSISCRAIDTDWSQIVGDCVGQGQMRFYAAFQNELFAVPLVIIKLLINLLVRIIVFKNFNWHFNNNKESSRDSQIAW